jgi:hypothetical protein
MCNNARLNRNLQKIVSQAKLRGLISGNTFSVNEGKINMLKAAMNDKQFLQDLSAIADDFSAVDDDIWEE